jgi:TP901 family phage tail tape measure protein
VASNVNIGGLEGDLILNTRDWTGPAREALSSLRALGSGVTSALDGINANTRQMAQSMQEMSSRTRQANTDMMQSFRQMGQAFASVVSDISRMARDVLGKAVSEFAQLDQAMHDVDSIAKLSGDGLQKLTKEVRSLGGEMGLTQGPVKLAEALKNISGAGFSATDAMKVLRASAKGADAGITDTKTFSRGVTALLRNYNLGADQATVVTDQMFKAMDQGDIEAEHMASSIGSIAPVASLAGVSLQELMGSLSAMSLNGKSFSENVTNYRAVLLHLLSPARDAQKLLEQYGVQAGETAIRTKGLLGVVQDLYAKTGGNKSVLKRVLDDEGLQASAALLKGDKGALTQSYIGEQYKADGATDDAFKRRAQGLMFQLQQLKASFDNFLLGVGAGVEPMLKPATEWLNKIAQSLLKLPDSTKAAIGGFLGLVAVGGSLLAGLTLLAPTFIQIGTWVASFGGVARLAAAAASSFEAGLTTLAAAASEFVAPIVLIGVNLALLKTAWEKDWGGIREFTTGVFEDIKRGATQAASWMQENLGPVARRIAQDFREGWPYVKDFFLWMGQTAAEIVVPAMQTLWDAAKSAWSGFSQVIQRAWAIVRPIIEAIGDGVQATMGVVAMAIDGDWNGAWTAAVEYLRGVVPRITKALDEIKVTVSESLLDLAHRIQEAFREALSPPEFKSETGWKATIDNPLARSTEVAKQKFGEIRDAGESLFSDLTKTSKRFGDGLSLGAAQAFSGSAVKIGGGPGTSNDDLVPYGKPKKKPSAESVNADRIASLALRHDGTLFRPGDKAQCANFVREVYREAGVPIGISSKPLDFKLTIGQPQGPGYANSFFGKDVGTLIQSMNELKKGDVLGFRNTYGNYAPGTITHAGVYVGDGKFTHRPTANAPVQTDSLNGYWGGQFASAVRPFALGKGGTGIGQGGINYQEVLAAHTKITELLGKQNNAYQTQRDELKKTYSEAMALAKDIGESQQTQNRLKADYLRKVGEVNDAERRENLKTSNELTVTRLAAEGKLGEAAKARIQATADEEKGRLQELLKTYPQMADQIAATSKAIDENAIRQQSSLALQDGGDHLNEVSGLQTFQRNDPGISSLMKSFPQFRAEIEAAYAAIQRYIKDPSEANLANFQASAQQIEKISGMANEAQQREIQSIEWKRQMGQITTDEAIAQQGQVLNNWVGGEDSKRQAILQYSDMYREYLQQQLELQGEFNLSSLESLAESLNQAGQLTSQQQAQLIAVNQLIQQQRLQDQQNWQGVLQSSMGAFQGFLGGLLTGQQSFSQSFSQLWKSLATQVIQEIVKMIIKATILQKILSSIFGWFGGILGIGGAAPIGAINIGDAGSAAGAGVGLSGYTFHSGGLVTSAGRVALPRFHSGGFVSGPLRSDETMAVLQTGEYVLSRQQLAAMRSNQGQARQAGPTVHVGGISVYASLENGMDVNQLGDQLGSRILSTIQGAA